MPIDNDGPANSSAFRVTLLAVVVAVIVVGAVLVGLNFSSLTAHFSGATVAAPTEPATAPPDSPAPIPDPTATASGSVSGSGSSTLVLTFVSRDPSGRVTAGGFVDGLIQTGGTCTLRLSKNGTVVSDEVEATPDSSTTQCGDLTIDADKLTPGTWRATLSYSSHDHHLVSPATPVVVS